LEFFALDLFRTETSSERRKGMKDLHKIFTRFKKDFPQVYKDHEALGKEIHEKSGPLPEKVRWLIKIAISGASRHFIALETHILKARKAGATNEEIKHALLMLIQTTGFPNFMEAYSVFKKLEKT
jgi:4-carboxymuconolactone decarboxylase